MSPGGDAGVDVASFSNALHLDAESGIWHAQAAHGGELSYPADQNDACFRLEDGSFWFAHRNQCILAAVRRFHTDGFILDIGGGNGIVAQALIDAGYQAALLEPGPVGARNARAARGLSTVINATVEDAGIRRGSVPHVGLFDVLEHIDDDRGFVGHLHDIVRPGGFLFLTVPAFNWLWSTSDVDAMHYRRYTRRSLTRVLADRFEVAYSTYLFQRLVPLSMLVRALPYRLRLSRPRPAAAYEREHAVGNTRLSAALSRMLKHEVGAIASGQSLVVGSTLLAVARRA